MNRNSDQAPPPGELSGRFAVGLRGSAQQPSPSLPDGRAASPGGRGKAARLLVGVLAPALVLLGLVWFLHGGHLLCVFYELTGLWCPGCGSGRAFRALLRGELLRALGHNAAFVLLGLPCGVLLAREYLRFVFPGLGLRKLALHARVGPAALAILLIFWLLRNLPAFAFLAP